MFLTVSFRFSKVLLKHFVQRQYIKLEHYTSESKTLNRNHVINLPYANAFGQITGNVTSKNAQLAKRKQCLQNVFQIEVFS